MELSASSVSCMQNRHRKSRLGSFVTSPFSNWKKFVEQARCHEKNAYHLDAVNEVRELKSLSTRKRLGVDELLDKNHRKRQKVAHEGVESIARAIILCGTQGIPLRGHDDDFVIYPANDYFTNRDRKLGNFNSLLYLQCASGDEKLRTHLKESPGNAKFVTHGPQNEMIAIAGDLIQQTIISRVKQSKFFSVLADGTTDIYKHDQFCLVLRYLHNGGLYEDFLEYVNASGSTTGEALADLILDRLRVHGLDLEKLRGQGYGGAANMTGIERGVKSRILEVYPKALFTHCGAHVLNLVIGDSCKELCMVKMFGVVNEVGVFFGSSAKRITSLESEIPETDVGIRPKVLCPTRWSGRLISLQHLIRIIVPVVSTFEKLSLNADSETSAKAASLLGKFEYPVFNSMDIKK